MSGGILHDANYMIWKHEIFMHLSRFLIPNHQVINWSDIVNPFILSLFLITCNCCKHHQVIKKNKHTNVRLMINMMWNNGIPDSSVNSVICRLLELAWTNICWSQ